MQHCLCRSLKYPAVNVNWGLLVKSAIWLFVLMEKLTTLMVPTLIVLAMLMHMMVCVMPFERPKCREK